MSKLQELINKLCPNGVEFKKLAEVFEMRNGYTPSKNNPDFWEGGTIPWFRMDDIRENGRILSDSIQHITPSAIKGKGLFEANSFILATTATIGEHALIIADSLANQQFTNLKVRKSLSNLLVTKFIYYYMFIVDDFCKRNTNVSGFASVDMDKLKKMPFPVPPIEVQEEIVRILDSFSDYAAELQAELQARKQQYEYYRNLLLTFNPSAYGCGTDDEQKDGVTTWEGRNYKIEWKKMGEIGTFIRGNGLQKKDFTESGVGCIHYGQIYTHYGTFATKTKSFVSESFAQKLRKAKTGDIVIATTSENVEDVGKAVAWLGNEDIAISGDAYIYTHEQNPKFIAYLFQTERFLAFKKMNVSGTKVTRISGDSLAKYPIPIPPLELQEKIVAILDRFETLVNDLTNGLPAEIAAVKDQYEYYRNKLLTFKKLSA